MESVSTNLLGICSILNYLCGSQCMYDMHFAKHHYYCDVTHINICKLCRANSKFIRYVYCCPLCQLFFCLPHYVVHIRINDIRSNNGAYHCKSNYVPINAISLMQYPLRYFKQIFSTIKVRKAFCKINGIQIGSSSITKQDRILKSMFNNYNIVDAGNYPIRSIL
jgi:hypothetical protein